MASRLNLDPTQKLRLQGAGLPAKQEIQLILDYAFHLKAVTADEQALLRGYAPTLGPALADALLKRLQDIQQHPEKYPDTIIGTGRHALFIMASSTGDRRLIPILTSFTKDSNKWVANSASRQLNDLILATGQEDSAAVVNVEDKSSATQVQATLKPVHPTN